MDLRYTAEEDAFRAEARAWLEANVPDAPLPSFDTEEGFALHREWERKLWDGRWSAVSWPEEYGGRGADYLHWLDLRGGVLPGRRARAGEPERHLPPRAHDHGGGHRRAEGALPADDGIERDRVGAGVERAQRRLRPRRHPRHGRAQRRRLRVGAQRAEDLGVSRRSGPTGASASSAPIRRRNATAGSPSSSSRSTRPASRCVRSRSSTATPASPRSSSTTSTCRSRTRWAT